MPYPERPHIAWPFSRDPNTGKLKVVEQDTVEHIMSCEAVIASTPLGYRHDRPEFGWPWPDLSSVPLDLGALTRALQQFEPRGTATASQYLDTVQAAFVHINVDVAIPSIEQTPLAPPALAPPYVSPPPTVDHVDGGQAATVFLNSIDGAHSNQTYSEIVDGGHVGTGGLPVTGENVYDGGTPAYEVYANYLLGGAAATPADVKDGGSAVNG